MSKTIDQLIREADTKWDIWSAIAEDPKALKEQNKTKEEALQLANFFEGRFEGLIDARNLL